MICGEGGNGEVKELDGDLRPSVLSQIANDRKIMRRNGVETSICGQAGSKKEMVKFLVEHGIDSISVNADVAADIAEYIVELEKGISPRERVEELGESEGEGTGDSVEEDLSEESKGYVAQDYTDSDDELPVIPGTEYTKIEEQEEETSLNDEELENRPGLVNLKEEGEKTRLSVSELKEKRPSVVDLKEETLDIF